MKLHHLFSFLPFVTFMLFGKVSLAQTCIDTKDYLYGGNPRKTCEWISSNEARRNEYCIIVEVHMACPFTCRTCCDDDKNYYVETQNGMKDCQWIGQNKERKDRWCKKKNNGSIVHEACPMTCENCCRDDPDYFFNVGLNKRKCGWLNEQKKKNKWCNTWNNGSMVSRACPVQCRKCCADDPGFSFKVGGKDKNCEWLATRNQRSSNKICRQKKNQILVEEACIDTCSLCNAGERITSTPSMSPPTSIPTSESSSSRPTMSNPPTSSHASATVINDKTWYDTKGDILQVGRGGKISVIDGKFYWVGTNAQPYSNGPGIYLYESELNAGGSSSWKPLGNIVDDQVGAAFKGLNCQIEKMKSGEYPYRMFCKNSWYKSKQIDSGWSVMPFRATIIDLKDLCPKCGDYNKLGAQSVYQHGGKLWWSAALNLSENHCKATVVFRFNKEWDKLSEKLVYIPNGCKNIAARESISILKYGGKWHMFSSGNKGWKPSNTYHRRAKSIQLLQKAKESQVVMYPHHIASPSHGTQFRQILKIRPGKWVYIGERYPIEDPTIYRARYGRRVMVPLIWNNSRPQVYYKTIWDFDEYDYSNPNFDKHTHHGNRPRCKESMMGHSCNDSPTKTQRRDHL